MTAAAGSTRLPTWKERENNKRRERRRRAIAAKIFAGLRTYGNYKLPKHCDNNEVLKALCAEAGWTVEEDGRTYRKGTNPRPAVEQQMEVCTATGPASVISPAASSYIPGASVDGTSSLIPWLKGLSASAAGTRAGGNGHGCCNSSSTATSAPVTPPLSSPKLAKTSCISAADNVKADWGAAIAKDTAVGRFIIPETLYPMQQQQQQPAFSQAAAEKAELWSQYCSKSFLAAAAATNQQSQLHQVLRPAACSSYNCETPDGCRTPAAVESDFSPRNSAAPTALTFANNYVSSSSTSSATKSWANGIRVQRTQGSSSTAADVLQEFKAAPVSGTANYVLNGSCNMQQRFIEKSSIPTSDHLLYSDSTSETPYLNHPWCTCCSTTPGLQSSAATSMMQHQARSCCSLEEAGRLPQARCSTSASGQQQLNNLNPDLKVEISGVVLQVPWEVAEDVAMVVGSRTSGITRPPTVVQEPDELELTLGPRSSSTTPHQSTCI
jgi:hypothetical protein